MAQVTSVLRTVAAVTASAAMFDIDQGTSYAPSPMRYNHRRNFSTPLAHDYNTIITIATGTSSAISNRFVNLIMMMVTRSTTTTKGNKRVTISTNGTTNTSRHHGARSSSGSSSGGGAWTRPLLWP